MKIAIYPGSFDPITNGHLDILKTSAEIFDKVIIAVLNNSEKKGFLTTDERIFLIRESIKDLKNVEVDGFDGLTVEYAKKVGAKVLIRGLRAVSDFEYEMQLSQANSALAKDIKTVFLTTKPKYNFISSTTKRITNLEQSLNEIKKAQYKFICLDYDLNSNIDFLKQIPSNLKNKIELLCNAICIPNCPNRINHYKINSEYALSYGKPYTLNCKAVKSVNSPEVIAYKNTVTLDKIYNLYYPLGIE